MSAMLKRFKQYGFQVFLTTFSLFICLLITISFITQVAEAESDNQGYNGGDNRQGGIVSRVDHQPTPGIPHDMTFFVGNTTSPPDAASIQDSGSNVYTSPGAQFKGYTHTLNAVQGGVTVLSATVECKGAGGVGGWDWTLNTGSCGVPGSEVVRIETVGCGSKHKPGKDYCVYDANGTPIMPTNTTPTGETGHDMFRVPAGGEGFLRYDKHGSVVWLKNSSGDNVIIPSGPAGTFDDYEWFLQNTTDIDVVPACAPATFTLCTPPTVPDAKCGTLDQNTNANLLTLTNNNNFEACELGTFDGNVAIQSPSPTMPGYDRYTWTCNASQPGGADVPCSAHGAPSVYGRCAAAASVGGSFNFSTPFLYASALPDCSNGSSPDLATARASSPPSDNNLTYDVSWTCEGSDTSVASDDQTCSATILKREDAVCDPVCATAYADMTTFNAQCNTHDALCDGLGATLTGVTSTSTIASVLAAGTTTPDATQPTVQQVSYSCMPNHPDASPSGTCISDIGTPVLEECGAADTDGSLIFVSEAELQAAELCTNGGTAQNFGLASGIRYTWTCDDTPAGNVCERTLFTPQCASAPPQVMSEADLIAQAAADIGDFCVNADEIIPSPAILNVSPTDNTAGTYQCRYNRPDGTDVDTAMCNIVIDTPVITCGPRNGQPWNGTDALCNGTDVETRTPTADDLTYQCHHVADNTILSPMCTTTKPACPASNVSYTDYAGFTYDSLNDIPKLCTDSGTVTPPSPPPGASDTNFTYDCSDSAGNSETCTADFVTLPTCNDMPAKTFPSFADLQDAAANDVASMCFDATNVLLPSLPTNRTQWNGYYHCENNAGERSPLCTVEVDTSLQSATCGSLDGETFSTLNDVRSSGLEHCPIGQQRTSRSDPRQWACRQASTGEISRQCSLTLTNQPICNYSQRNLFVSYAEFNSVAASDPESLCHVGQPVSFSEITGTIARYECSLPSNALNASCPAIYDPMFPRCGSATNNAYADINDIPVDALCANSATLTARGITDTNNQKDYYNWECERGGVRIDCRADEAETPPEVGQCGPAHGNNNYRYSWKIHPYDLCSQGTPQGEPRQSGWDFVWQCGFGSDAAQCSANFSDVPQCGSINGLELPGDISRTAPDTDLCGLGSLLSSPLQNTTIPGSKYRYSWKCNMPGNTGAEAVDCSADYTLPYSNECGTLSNTTTTAALRGTALDTIRNQNLTSSLCTGNGTFVNDSSRELLLARPVNGLNQYLVSWDCTDNSSGLRSECTATLQDSLTNVTQPECGSLATQSTTFNATDIQNATASQLCAVGTTTHPPLPWSSDTYTWYCRNEEAVQECSVAVNNGPSPSCTQDIYLNSFDVYSLSPSNFDITNSGKRLELSANFSQVRNYYLAGTGNMRWISYPNDFVFDLGSDVTASEIMTGSGRKIQYALDVFSNQTSPTGYSVGNVDRTRMHPGDSLNGGSFGFADGSRPNDILQFRSALSNRIGWRYFNSEYPAVVKFDILSVHDTITDMFGQQHDINNGCNNKGVILIGAWAIKSFARSPVTSDPGTPAGKICPRVCATIFVPPGMRCDSSRPAMPCVVPRY